MPVAAAIPTWLVVGFLAVFAMGEAASAETLYDNGSVIEADLGLRDNFGTSSVYDDFVLTSDSVVTGFEWSQFDEPVTYTNTVLTLFDGLPAPSSFVTNFDVVASRTSNGLMLETDKVNSGEVFGFDYSVEGLSQFVAIHIEHWPE